MLFPETSSAKILTFEESGDEFIIDVSTVTFVNANGVFDGTTDYVEVTSSIKNNEENLEGTIYHLIDLRKPYSKIYKMYFTKMPFEIAKGATLITNSQWKSMASNDRSHNYELYHEVVKYVDQNRKAIYDHSIKQADKSAQNLSWNGTWNTIGATIKITQNNDIVECMINDKKFIGTINGNIFTGKWSDMKFFSSVEPQGHFRFIMSPEGKHLKIQWQDDTMGWVTDLTADRIK